jgi:hypothetical protein
MVAKPSLPLSCRNISLAACDGHFQGLGPAKAACDTNTRPDVTAKPPARSNNSDNAAILSDLIVAPL